MNNNLNIEIEYLEHFPAGKKLLNKNNPFIINLIYASTEITELVPFQRKLFKTGIKIKFPEYGYGYVIPCAKKFLDKGLTIMTPGIFTSDYDQEIEVLLYNVDCDIFVLKPYVKIGELLINHGLKLNFNPNPKKTIYNKKSINFRDEDEDEDEN